MGILAHRSKLLPRLIVNMDSEDSEDSEFTTKPLQKLLVKLYDDLTEAARDLRTIRHAIRETPSYTHPRPLQAAAKEATGLKKASMDDLVKLWAPGWTIRGRRVQLGTGPEVELLGFQANQEVDVYDLFTPIQQLFKN